MKVRDALLVVYVQNGFRPGGALAILEETRLFLFSTRVSTSSPKETCQCSPPEANIRRGKTFSVMWRSIAGALCSEHEG